ncbi:sensor histidine kinase [Micromonosporaceae bacterium Da 78-11]
MPRTQARALPVALFAGTCLASVASVPISVGREPQYDVILYPLNAVALCLAGSLIATHRRRNPIGWVLIVMGAMAAWVELTEGYAYHSAWPWALRVEWLTNWGSMLGVGTTAIVLSLFPSGRELGAIRRALVWAGAVATALTTAGAAFGHSSDPMFEAGVNPYAVAGWEPVYAVGQVLFTVALLGAIASLIVRFRRSTGVEHQQLKWVAYVVAMLAVIGPPAIFRYNESALVRVAIAFVVTALPAAICVAILRYRLDDIDIIVNRTLVYGVLTVLLAAGYAVTALALGTALGGRRSPWVTAGATLAVAAAFRPLRARIQDAVDRRFRRARYDALTRVDAFLDDLRAGRAEPEMLQQLLRDVTAQPDLEVRYLLPDTGQQIDGGGRDLVGGPGEGRLERSVQRAGVPLAVVHAEATAYFVACEALTNAVKHSAATGVELPTERLDGHLVMTVRDNGVGGARPSHGTGLRGLSDRVAAHGGRMRVDSPDGIGTTLIAELPCVS